MKLHHKKHAENLKQYLEWKNTQSKQHDQTKTGKKTDVKVKNEADMALQNSVIQMKSRALGVLDSVSPTTSNLLLRKAASTGI